MSEVPKPTEMKPCQYCRIMPFVFNTHNPPNVIGGWMAMCGAVECKNPQASIGKTKAEAFKNWNTRASTPPAAVAEDAVEALELPKVFAAAYNAWHQAEYGWDMPDPSALRFGEVFSKYFNNKLAAQGYTLRRETMTEAELEREADELVTMAFTGSIGIGDWKAATKALAKKYRG